MGDQGLGSIVIAAQPPVAPRTYEEHQLFRLQPSPRFAYTEVF